MAGQKRDKLLSDKERERLISRDAQNKEVTSTNDGRAKRKLSAWLKNVDDVIIILNNLPEELIRDVSNEEDIYKLLNLSTKLLALKKFYRVVGDIEIPQDWHVLDFEGTRIRAANDEDITRAFCLGKWINRLNRYYGAGMENPVYQAMFYDEWKNHPAFEGKITPDIERGIKRVKEATGGNLDTLMPQQAK